MSRGWIGLALGLAAIAGVVLVASGRAGAGDEPAGSDGGMQKKIDHPLAKVVLGTWDLASKAEWGEGKGTVKFALGVGDTALLQDYHASVTGMGDFDGHGIWKFSDDGKTLNVWWLDAHLAAPEHYTGAVTDTGYDLKSDGGLRITLAKVTAGLEFKLYGADGKLFFTDTYTKK